MKIDCKIRIEIDEEKMKYLLEDIEHIRAKLETAQEKLEDMLKGARISVI